MDERLRVRLQWERKEHDYVYWPGEDSTATVAELYAAVRGFAPARGVAVALEKKGNCLVCDLA